MRRMLALVVFLAAGLLGTAPVSAAAATPYCGITWGSLAKSAGAVNPAASLVNARTGQHDCYDRVVFDFQGSADGYNVFYTASVDPNGSGHPLHVAGGATLNVTLKAPALPAYNHTYDEQVGHVRGYRTLRDLVYGGSFEGYTTFGLGVRARLPFRVFTLPGPGSGSRIVLDVAHQWSQ